MLTNLSWLDVGERFPPKSEKDRLRMYQKNRELFESNHAEVYEEDLKRIERVIGNFEDVVSYPVVLNFQKLMSLKIADLLLGEPPHIKAGEEDSKEQETIKLIQEKSMLQNTSYQVAIDTSRYGDGLFYIRKGVDGGVIDLTNPSIWFPVVSPDNVREIMYHVLAWEYSEKSNGTERHYLKAQIHSKGSYEERILETVGGMIAKVVVPSRVVYTGLDGNAIVQVSNVITTDRATGLDDYTDVDSIISELMVRVGQISRILDKHASPSMSGPQTALEPDPITGEWSLKSGNFFPRDSRDDPAVEYITWDGQLAANFTHIEKLINLLYTISEMGSAIFGDLTASTGQVPSGTALKRLMISPLAKVNRIRMRFDPALKNAINLASQLGGKNIVNLKDTDISIIWQDGLPGDAWEEAQIIEKRTAGSDTMSTKRALMQFDGMSSDDADKELEMIQDENAFDTLEAPTFSQADKGTIEAIDDGEDMTPTDVSESLNGAQMKSLLDIITAVNEKTLTRDSAIVLVTSSLPISEEQARKIIK